VVSRYEPRPYVPGEAQVDVDLQGRLFGLVVVQPERDTSPPAVGEPDWAPLFQAAGLEPARFHPMEPEWNPPVAVDHRSAWVGEAPDLPGLPLRLEAASYRGRPVFLKTIGPWTRTQAAEKAGRSPRERLSETLNAVLWLLLLGGALLAYRNVRLGRGDRRGAWRVGAWFFAAHTLVWLGQATHAHDVSGEWYIVQRDLGYNLFLTALLWIGYVAVEPYVRRVWPETLISWSRLLAGRFADPRVGRDVLVGVALGGGSALLEWSMGAVRAWRAGEPTPPRWSLVDRFPVGMVDQLVHSVLDSLLVLFVLVLFVLVLRRRGLAVTLVMVSSSLIFQAQAGPRGDWATLPLTWLLAVVLVLGLTRFGLVALATASFVSRLLLETPWTLDTQVWYAWETWAAGAVLVALLAFGFRAVTAGRPVFATRLLEA
jgi:hypothetical protein